MAQIDHDSPGKSVPKLSIAVPVYNGENFLGQLLDCLLGQTFQDFEIVIGENVSTDKTMEVIRAYAARDGRIRYFQNEVNVGPIENYNRILRQCRGMYTKLSCHDDLYAPTFLEKCVQVLDAYPDVVVAGTDSVFVDANMRAFEFDKATRQHFDPVSGARFQSDPIDLAGSRFALARFADIIFNADHSHANFGVMRREILLKTSMYRQLYECDQVLLLELSLYGKIFHHRERLFYKRFHPNMSAAANRTESIKTFLGSRAGVISWRGRKIKEYFRTPWLTPIGLPLKLACTLIVGIYVGVFATIVGLRRLGVLRTPDDMQKAALRSSGRDTKPRLADRPHQ